MKRNINTFCNYMHNPNSINLNTFNTKNSLTATNLIKSPTDNIFSPCTSILRKRKKYKINEKMNNELNFNVKQPTNLPIILGSSSKNRRMIMDSIGWKYTVQIPDIDEKAIRCDNPFELPVLIAKAKAEALISRYDSTSSPEVFLITMDQVTLYDNKVREKPVDSSEAREFLSSYSNSSVQTIAAIVVTHIPSLKQSCQVDIAKVNWNNIPNEVIEKIVAGKDVYTAAGGFLIEDEDLSKCIHSIEGTRESVMGFPVEPLLKAFEDVLNQIKSI